MGSELPGGSSPTAAPLRPSSGAGQQRSGPGAGPLRPAAGPWQPELLAGLVGGANPNPGALEQDGIRRAAAADGRSWQSEWPRDDEAPAASSKQRHAAWAEPVNGFLGSSDGAGAAAHPGISNPDSAKRRRMGAAPAQPAGSWAAPAAQLTTMYPNPYPSHTLSAVASGAGAGPGWAPAWQPLWGPSSNPYPFWGSHGSASSGGAGAGQAWGSGADPWEYARRSRERSNSHHQAVLPVTAGWVPPAAPGPSRGGDPGRGLPAAWALPAHDPWCAIDARSSDSSTWGEMRASHVHYSMGQDFRKALLLAAGQRAL